MTGLRKRVAVLYAPGTNCAEETMAAIRLAGGNPQLLFMTDILRGRVRITDCDCFCVAGGFSGGDHIATGILVATLLADHFRRLAEAKIPTCGICNGFQILDRARLFTDGVTLTRNDSEVFCSMPVKHRVEKFPCVWTKGLEGKILTFPSAHGYGKVVGEGKPNVVLTYESESPNGGQIAGICSDNGLIFGLMDHPERHYDNQDGLEIFRNGIKAA
jgi:phosphoribosylformylglycinamidine synthase